jgi:hypothetical protein
MGLHEKGKQGYHNPRVGGSSPSSATNKINRLEVFLLAEMLVGFHWGSKACVQQRSDMGRDDKA